MSLVFTNDQIKELTGQVLAAPQKIADLVTNKAKATQLKQDFKDLDDGHAIFTNNTINIINQYHTELKYLNGQARTTYASSSIDPAGRLSPGNIHFSLDPIWAAFPPQSAPSNTGLPTSVWTDTETAAITNLNQQIALLTSGFTDGAASTTTTAAFVSDEVEVTSASGFAVGNRVLFISTGNYLYGTITLITALKLKITILSASAGFGGIATSATVRNFHTGFTLSQRESGLAGTVGETAYMTFLKSNIDTQVGVWKVRLNAELTALNANDVINPEKTEVDNTKTIVNNHLTAISTWQGHPTTGTGTSRFGTNLPPLQTDAASRPAEMTSRASAIVGYLGSVTQDAEGAVTGSGHYLNLIQNLNLRLNKMAGSLRNFYQNDLIGTAFDQQIMAAQALADRDSQTFIIREFSEDASGSDLVRLTDVSNLSGGQAVKVMSNTQPVLDLTIVSITGTDVLLSAIIPDTYKLADKSRIVVQN